MNCLRCGHHVSALGFPINEDRVAFECDGCGTQYQLEPPITVAEWREMPMEHYAGIAVNDGKRA